MHIRQESDKSEKEVLQKLRRNANTLLPYKQ